MRFLIALVVVLALAGPALADDEVTAETESSVRGNAKSYILHNEGDKALTTIRDFDPKLLARWEKESVTAILRSEAVSGEMYLVAGRVIAKIKGLYALSVGPKADIVFVSAPTRKWTRNQGVLIGVTTLGRETYVDSTGREATAPRIKCHGVLIENVDEAMKQKR